PWKEWPVFRDPSAADIGELWEEGARRDGRLFHAWVQMRCEEQFLAACRDLAGRGIALKGDIPILMNDDSADCWAHRPWFRMDRIAGAPPDMFSELGQNWGFPIYDWAEQAREGYSFWKDRLRRAAKFYGACRIDHVLGFFRIWALPEREESGYLGAFEPSAAITRAELRDAGFSGQRVRWLSEPHIREAHLLEAACRDDARPGGAEAGAAAERAGALLDRLGSEPLYLFRESVRGEKDIQASGLPDAVRGFLLAAWRDRVLVPLGTESFAPAWRHYSASAWATLSDTERSALEGLIRGKAAESELRWEDFGRRLLGVLISASDMLFCAEDLGAVPPFVPSVLAELGILGLRIPRWTRRWGEPGEPCVEPGDYPRLTVCSPSVHDTSTLRDWWEHEAGEADRVAALGDAKAPAAWSCETAARALARLAAGASALLAVQLQDLLDLSPAYASLDSREDRINIPGTVSETNWTWRMPVTLETLASDAEWAGRVAAAAARPAG
ncbi:MAG TPA: 4-alpha-glucanotransferase, partial [Magnetospirillaceae bacterium]|nr:4-alpha-glucanotransferase [Magnetospirillaceae bacterium]